MATGWVFRKFTGPLNVEGTSKLVFWARYIRIWKPLFHWNGAYSCLLCFKHNSHIFQLLNPPNTNHFVRHCQLRPRCCSQCFPRTGDQPSGGRWVAEPSRVETNPKPGDVWLPNSFQTSVNRPFSNRQSTWSTGRPHLVGGLEHFFFP